VWLPATYADADVHARRVVENHYTELKRTYEQTDGGRRELAKDLAALALDGGVLVIGVDEDDLGRAVKVMPVDLANFAERIDSAALYRCDPPVVDFGVTPLPDSADENETTGILVVEVAAHPDAPVMVDSRYYGRGERSVRRLSDAEVVRLHQARALEAEHVERTLDTAVDEARAALPEHQVGRLTIVAEPAPIRRADVMAGVYAGHGWWRWQQEADAAAAAYVRLQDSRSPALTSCLYGGDPFSPLQHLGGGTAPGRQPRGVAVKGGERTSGHMGYLHLDESGALRLVINRIIMQDLTRSVLDWHFAVSATTYAVGMFTQIRQKSGLHSRLDVGVHLDHLRGVVPTPTGTGPFRWSVTRLRSSTCTPPRKWSNPSWLHTSLNVR
jgi:hypothetical protein